jgi:hypothetical protein
MDRLTILVVFLFILFIQFNQQEAARVYPSSSLDEVQDPLYLSPLSAVIRSSLYHRLNDISSDNEPQEDIDNIWKRFSPELLQLRQRRRFGNTRYGRSLPNDWK